MGITVNFTGLCLFLRTKKKTFEVLLPKGHSSHDVAPHKPYLIIDTDSYKIDETTETPDIVIVAPGAPQRQIALWDLRGRNVVIGNEGPVDAVDSIPGPDEGPPAKWGDLHWMINMKDVHERDTTKFKGHRRSSDDNPDLDALAGRVRLRDGTLSTVEPRYPQKYAVMTGPTKEYARYFADTIRFSTHVELLKIGPFNGEPKGRIVLEPDAKVSVTCQSTEGSLAHFAHYYDVADPDFKPIPKTLSAVKALNAVIRNGFPIDCVPPGEGEGPP